LGVAQAADIHRGRGRPSALTPAVADVIVARVAAGDTLTVAAQAAGVGERTLRTWRRRAYSVALADRPHVELEQRLQAARLVAAQAVEPSGERWRTFAHRLASEFPERWEGLPERSPLDFDELLDLYSD
jgi:Helix-turn-helix domain